MLLPHNNFLLKIDSPFHSLLGKSSVIKILHFNNFQLKSICSQPTLGACHYLKLINLDLLLYLKFLSFHLIDSVNHILAIKHKRELYSLDPLLSSCQLPLGYLIILDSIDDHFNRVFASTASNYLTHSLFLTPSPIR